MTSGPPTVPPDLEQLLAELRAARSEPSALLRRFCSHLHQMARKHLPAGDALRRVLDSEDLAQETLLELIRGIDRFTGTSWNEFFAFARAVLTQRAAEHGRHWRRGKRDPRRLEPLPDAGLPGDGTPTPSRVAITGEDRSRAEALMADLPEPLRAALLLRLSGLDYVLVAARLGISDVAARQRVSRALAWLKAHW